MTRHRVVNRLTVALAGRLPAESLFAERDFAAFAVANCLERFAASAMVVLLGFQIYDITHNALDLGWLGLVEAIPGVTLVLYGGHVADRHSRRRIVAATAAALAVLALAMAVVSGAGERAILPALYGVAFVGGVVRAFEGPAASGLEAQVVPLDRLLAGLGVLATSGRLSDVLGPVAGGLAWAAIGPVATYAVIGALFAAASWAVLAGIAERALPPVAPERAGETTARRILDGVRYVFADQLLLGSMALDLFAVFFGGATALLPAFATDILHVGPAGFGLLRGASGAGALLAAILAARLLPSRRAGAALMWVILGFGISIIVFGLSRSLPLSLAALFVAGLCDGTSVVIRRAILRLASPEAMRGRIAAVKSVFVGSSNELGAFESGIAAHLIGVPAAVWTGGVVTILVVAVTAWRAPRLRALDLDAMAARSQPQLPDLQPVALDLQ